MTASVSTEALTRRTWSDRIDRFATAPVIGPLLFLGVMWVVFQATTTLAAPLQDALDALVSGPVSSAGGWLVDTVGLGRTPVRGLVVDGVIAGVGMLLTFVPLMALMFLLLALLEDSGYLARAAVVTDRMMSRLGLPGRAFLPIVVGFGCNVPAVAATRILPNARHRVLTALLVPFTSCSARLTVYVLLATTFFPAHAGTVVFAMYLVSILLVVVVGLGLRATLWRAVGADPLVIDLPPYQRPTVRLSLSVTWLRLQGFLRTASGIIVATVVVVWLLQSIPVGPGSFGDVPVSDSLYAAAVAGGLAAAGTGRVRPVGGGVGAARRVRGQGGRDLVVGADLRARRAGLVARPGCARGAAAPDLRRRQRRPHRRRPSRPSWSSCSRTPPVSRPWPRSGASSAPGGRPSASASSSSWRGPSPCSSSRSGGCSGERGGAASETRPGR